MKRNLEFSSLIATAVAVRGRCTPLERAEELLPHGFADIPTGGVISALEIPRKVRVR
jgi:hypothetical protein